jgi:hypothetical protein
MGFGVRIAPGVRVSASSRGIRAGVGPRGARVHVGGGPTRISSGVGPFTYSTTVGGGRRSSGSSRTSVAAYEREMRRLAREPERDAVARAEQMLVSAHLEDFPAPTPATAPAPEPVDAAAIQRAHKRDALNGISIFARSERRAAKARAQETAAQAIRDEEAHRAEEQRHTQAALDAAWRALMANDPDAVLHAIEAAFADNEAPAAAVDVQGARVTLLMMAPDPAVVPERKPALTPAGRPTLKKRTKAELNDLYVSAIASYVFATVKEALAVAPGLQDANIIVLRREPSAGLGDDKVVALFAGRFPRTLLDDVHWNAIDLARVLDEVPDALLRRRGRTGELAPLDLADEPDLAEIVGHVQQALAA